MNFREVNKKLNELKQAELKAFDNWRLSYRGSKEEYEFNFTHYQALKDLIQFRNTKISEINFK